MDVPRSQNALAIRNVELGPASGSEMRRDRILWRGKARPPHIYDAVVPQRFPRETLINLPLPLFTRSLSPFHLPAPNNFLLRPTLDRHL